MILKGTRFNSKIHLLLSWSFPLQSSAILYVFLIVRTFFLAPTFLQKVREVAQFPPMLLIHCIGTRLNSKIPILLSWSFPLQSSAILYVFLIVRTFFLAPIFLQKVREVAQFPPMHCTGTRLNSKIHLLLSWSFPLQCSAVFLIVRTYFLAPIFLQKVREVAQFPPMLLIHCIGTKLNFKIPILLSWSFPLQSSAILCILNC